MSSNGKGSRRRDSSITDSMFKSAWERIFAKRAKNKRRLQARKAEGAKRDGSRDTQSKQINKRIRKG